MADPQLAASALEHMRARHTALVDRIGAACARSGRSSDDVRLLAVTKGHPVQDCARCLELGLLDLGENYVQEWREKALALAPHQPPVRWHFIGRLQSNKAAVVASAAWSIHSVDRDSLVTSLTKRCEGRQEPLRIFVQVNVAGEPQKGGCEPEAILRLVTALGDCPGILPVGLMTVAPDVDDPEEVRPVFRALRLARDRVRDALPPRLAETFRELSMGMSHDLDVAVEEGATWLRVGTALLGARG